MGALAAYPPRGASASRRTSTLFRWRLTIPPEKGSWVWMVGPLILGMAAAGRVTTESLAVVAAALAGFCVRQPLTLLVKMLSGRRSRGDLPGAMLWTAVYLTVLLAAGGWLLLAGHEAVVLLGAAGVPVMAAHLALAYRGAGNRQRGLLVAGAATLAATGTAAYWAGGGAEPWVALLIWLLPVAHFEASIVHIGLKLRQRRLDRIPRVGERGRQAAVPLLVHVAALLLAAAIAGYGMNTALAVAALAVPLADGIHAALRPPIGHTPKRIGIRQLAVSTLSLALLALAVA